MLSIKHLFKVEKWVGFGNVTLFKEKEKEMGVHIYKACLIWARVPRSHCVVEPKQERKGNTFEEINPSSKISKSPWAQVLK